MRNVRQSGGIAGRPRLARLLAISLVIALLAAACGGRGDDDDTGAGNGTTAPPTDTNGDDDGDGDGRVTIDTDDCLTDPSTPLEGDTIRLGTSLPQSGLYSAFAEILRGEQAYIRYVNEELGGVEIGGQSYQLELQNRDDEYLAERTLSAVQELVQSDNVFALFNVVGTKNNLAIREFVDENCIPNLFAATGSPAWGNPEYPWMLGTFLVPYPLEAKAFADYLKENKPDATVAILFANDDFGRSYAETFKSEIEGTDITIVGEQNYDPETPDPTNQVTSLARTGADAFLLAATLTACPTALNAMGAAGWDPIVYMSGTCGSKTLMALAGENGDGVITVAPLVDPNDPQYAETEALQLYRDKIAQYGDGADPTNGIVAYGWSAGAMLVELLSRLDSVSRLSVMEAGRNMDTVQGIGLQIPGVTWSVSADDWFLGESFNLGQYSFADGYFVEVGDVLDFEGRTAEITPPGLING